MKIDLRELGMMNLSGLEGKVCVVHFKEFECESE